MKPEELEIKLKQGKNSVIYLLYGEETFLLENTIKAIKKNFGELITGINYIILDENNIESIISDIETPAFGYEKKLIIVKNAGIFKKDSKKKAKKNESQDIKERINEYILLNIEQMKDTVVLVFVEESVEKCELVKTIEKYGIVCNFESLKPFQIQNKLKSIINAYKVNIEMNTISYIIECCGTDMQELINECRKLIEYAGMGGTITREDVDKLCIKKMESIIFELTDSLAKKNTKQAIDILHNLILSKEPIQKILSTLYTTFKKLYLAKIAILENKDLIYSLDLKPNQTFLVNKYKQQANYFKKEELRRILKELCDLDYKYKTGIVELQTGLESILCAYI